MDAAARLKNHQDIYAPPYYHIYFQYFYSPLFALILLPFTFLPFSVFETLWVMFMFFCLYDIWKMSKEYFDIRNFSNQKNLVWLFGTLFFILSFILYNISQVQMTVFLLWATLCALKMFDKKRFLPGGILLGLVINIKIMPIIFLPYLIYRNQWRA
ncbi:MAG TPA: glycosyltransferase family 87 protein, partial [Candidatus Paceibacterota bacterium]|nr:glycosyltransferase family 87 protein [Candidatus Paceibacterota bacterium]